MNIDELAAAGGVNRRTVRYYIQRGLLAAPFGVGRGKHYGPEHLRRLIEVRTLQENGASLEQIRSRYPIAELRSDALPRASSSTKERAVSEPIADPQAPTQHTAKSRAWVRFAIAEGIELHVQLDQLSKMNIDQVLTTIDAQLSATATSMRPAQSHQ